MLNFSKSMSRNDSLRALAVYLPKPPSGGISIFPPLIDFGTLTVGNTYSVPLVVGMHAGSLEEDFVDVFLPKNDFIQVGMVSTVFFSSAFFIVSQPHTSNVVVIPILLSATVETSTSSILRIKSQKQNMSVIIKSGFFFTILFFIVDSSYAQ